MAKHRSFRHSWSRPLAPPNKHLCIFFNHPYLSFRKRAITGHTPYNKGKAGSLLSHGKEFECGAVTNQTACYTTLGVAQHF